MNKEFVTLTGIDKTVNIKRSSVVKITVEKTQNLEKPYMVDIKTSDKKFDSYLMFRSKEEADSEVEKFFNP